VLKVLLLAYSPIIRKLPAAPGGTRAGGTRR